MATSKVHETKTASMFSMRWMKWMNELANLTIQQQQLNEKKTRQ